MIDEPQWKNAASDKFFRSYKGFVLMIDRIVEPFVHHNGIASFSTGNENGRLTAKRMGYSRNPVNTKYIVSNAILPRPAEMILIGFAASDNLRQRHFILMSIDRMN